MPMTTSDCEGSQTASREIAVLCVTCAIVALVAGLFVYTLATRMPEQMLRGDMFDVYFGADLPRSYRDMTTRGTPFGGGAKHPLFCLALLPFSFVLRFVVGLPAINATHLMLAANACAWSALLFALCWHVTRRLVDTVVLVLFALSSASAIFWLPVPETYAFGSTTILLALLVLCSARTRGSYAAHILGQIVSLAMTVTNWMAGIIASVLGLGVRRAVSATILAFAIAGLLCIAQSFMLTHATYSLNPRQYVTESQFINTNPLGKTLEQFFLAPLSPRSIEYRMTAKGEYSPKWDLPVVCTYCPHGTVRQTIEPPVSGGRIYIVVCLIWLAVLALGLGTAAAAARQSVLLCAALLVLAGQFVLHLLYGSETFIYSLHWFALFTLVAASPFTTRLRIPCLVAIALLTVYGFVTNLSMYVQVMAVLESIVPPAIAQI